MIFIYKQLKRPVAFSVVHHSAVVVTVEVCGARMPETVSALNMVMLDGVD